jgi:hypothetical protein
VNNGQAAEGDSVVMTVTLSSIANQTCTPEPPSSSPSLPSEGTILFVDIAAFYGDTEVTSITFDPPRLNWTSSDIQLQKDVLVTIEGTSPSFVNITGRISGNATSYRGFVTQLVIRRPASVTITFPPQLVYANQTASVSVNISSPVAVTTNVLNFTIALSNACKWGCVEVVSQSTIVFNAASPLVQAFLLVWKSANNFASVFTVEVTITPGGSAMNEYNFSSTVTKQGITFSPKEKIYYSVPKFIFSQLPFTFNMTLSSPPDPSTYINLYFTSSPPLLQVIWTSQSPLSQSLSFAPPYLSSNGGYPDYVSVTLTLAGSDFSAVNKYEAPLTLVFPVYTQLTVLRNASLTPAMRPQQVVGPANSQTVALYISRAPLRAFSLTIVANEDTSAMLTFTPTTFVWTNCSSCSLERQLTVTGNAPGTASNLGFLVESTLPQEIAAVDPNHDILPASLQIVDLYTLAFSGSFSQLFVGADNAQPINVSLSNAPATPVNISVTFSADGAATFSPSMYVVFTPKTGVLWQLVNMTGVAPASGVVTVQKVSGSEFNSLAEGYLSVDILPIVAVTIFYGGQPINATLPGESPCLLASDSLSSFDLTISSIEAATYSLGVVVPSGPSPQHAVILLNSSLTFGTLGNTAPTKSFFIAAVAKIRTPFALIVSLNTTTAPRSRFHPSYNISCAVEADSTMLVTNFPPVLYAGSANAAVFEVAPVPPPTGVSVLMGNLDANCVNVNVTPTRQLLWTSAMTTPVDVRLQGAYEPNSQCTVQITKDSTLMRTQVAPFIPPNFFLLYTLSVTVSPAPEVILVSPAPDAVIPIGTIRSNDIPFKVTILNGALNTTSIGPPVIVSAQDSDYTQIIERYAIVVVVASTPAEEPGGFQSLGTPASFIKYDVTDSTQLVVEIGPTPNLVLVNDETVTVLFTKLAFRDAVTPMNGSFDFTVQHDSSTAVASKTQISLGFVTGAAFVASMKSTSVIIQLWKANSLLQLFGCPEAQWQTDLYPFGTISNDETLAEWLRVAALMVGGVAAVYVVHFAVVFTTSFIGIEKVFSKKTREKFVGEAHPLLVSMALFHFPAAPTVLVYLFTQISVTYGVTVLFYTTEPQYRVAAFCTLLFPLLVFPYFMFAVVWKARSPQFIPYPTRALFAASGFWHHPTSPTFMRRYGALFAETRENYRWYLLLELSVAIAVGIAQGVRPSSLGGCVGQGTVITALLGIEWVCIILLRPYRFPIHNALYSVALLGQLVCAAITTDQLRYTIRDDQSEMFAIAMLFASAALLLCIAVASILRWKPSAKSAAIEKWVNEKTAKINEEDQYDVKLLPAEQQQLDQEYADDDEEVLSPSHPLYNTDCIEPDPTGIFRNDFGAIRGNEMAFSRIRKQELAKRQRLHLALLDDIQRTRDGAVRRSLSPVAADSPREAELPLIPATQPPAKVIYSRLHIMD